MSPNAVAPLSLGRAMPGPTRSPQRSPRAAAAPRRCTWAGKPNRVPLRLCKLVSGVNVSPCLHQECLHPGEGRAGSGNQIGPIQDRRIPVA